MHLVTVKNEWYGSYAEKINMSHLGLNLGQTAEDSDKFTNIWLSSNGIIGEHSFIITPRARDSTVQSK